MSVTNAVGVESQTVDKCLRTIGALFQPSDVIEIRALDVGRTPDRAGSTYAGYFDFGNSEAIAAAIRSVDGKAEGVYVVLNRFNPDLLARSNNRLKVKLKNTTSDADVLEFRWLYIDADPVRPAGISSTDGEHLAALERVVEIREFLSDQGWPEPIQADSGNGAHLLYRLPVLEVKQAGDLVKRCLKSLSQRFSDAVVKVDEATANPARICKLYATLTRKGDSMPDRPHRRSALTETPERIETVPVDALEALASETVVPIPSQANRNAPRSGDFNIDQWLGQSGLEIIRGPEPYADGRKWTLRACPFNPEHQKPVVIALSGGALVYKCLHKSCIENDWKELRGLVQPDCKDRAVLSIPRISDLETSSQSAGITGQTPLITNLSQIPSVFSLESTLDWCVEGMIAQGSVTLICAESGTGKTWLGYYLAGCVAHGFPVLELPVRRCKVLYLDGENPLYLTKQRFHDLGIPDTPDLTVWGGWNLSPPVGPEHELILEFAREQKGLIIYDSLIEFHPGSEQSSTETRAFMRHFRALANLGATVVVLHHTGKADTSKQYRGSSDIKGVVDTAYVLGRSSMESEIGDLTMTSFKARLAPGRNFSMEFKKGIGFVLGDASKAARSTTEIIAEILADRPGVNQKEIVRLAYAEGCSKGQVENCLKSQYWQKVKGSNNSTLYSLPAERQDIELGL